MSEPPLLSAGIETLPALDSPPWLRPVGLLAGGDSRRAVSDGTAMPLAGGPLAFGSVELLARRQNGIVTALATLGGLRQWALRAGPATRDAVEARLARLAAARPAWAGLALDRPLIMGILNVTPDSFSDGGSFLDPTAAIAQARAMLTAGADIVDIGGESTRPHAAPVSPDEESARVEPVLRALVAAGATVSIDTRHAAVMARALAAGARIVNDVTALSGDAASLAIVARARAAIVLMHMQGEPRTMQDDPRYALASLDIADYLASRIALARTAGIAAADIVVDPGIGFGKARRHNLEILARVALFQGLGTGVMVGLSRKSLVGGVTGAPVGERLPGSLAGALHAVSQGVQIVRVHDVAETRQAIALARAIAGGA